MAHTESSKRQRSQTLPTNGSLNMQNALVKPSTLDHYQRIVRVHLIPYFGGALLKDITPDQVQGFVSEKLAEGKLTPKTINNSLVPLKAMFKHAVRWGYLRESPALYVEKPRVDRKEMDFLTPEEI